MQGVCTEEVVPDLGSQVGSDSGGLTQRSQVGANPHCLLLAPGVLSFLIFSLKENDNRCQL